MKKARVRLEIDLDLEWNRGKFPANQTLLNHYYDELFCKLEQSWGGVNKNRFRPTRIAAKLIETPNGVPRDGEVTGS